MIIRSQDKGSIRNFNLISDLVISKNRNHWEIVACYPYFAQSDCAFSVIGEYSTQEKAIKVLDMIQEHYDKVMDARHWNDEYQENYFIMPSDEEVEV